MGKEARGIRQDVSHEPQSLVKVRSGMVGLDEVLQSVLSGRFSITPLPAILRGQVHAMGATCILIDAMDVFMRIFRDERSAALNTVQ